MVVLVIRVMVVFVDEFIQVGKVAIQIDTIGIRAADHPITGAILLFNAHTHVEIPRHPSFVDFSPSTSWPYL